MEPGLRGRAVAMIFRVIANRRKPDRQYGRSMFEIYSRRLEVEGVGVGISNP